VTARAEKAVRLVTASLISFVFGLLAVILDNQAFAWVAVGIILVAILAGPVLAPLLRNAPRGRPGP
jgi:multisubunit Na+/H+ antiporter MnhG subunit